MKKSTILFLHLVILSFASLTWLPFVFVLNNSFRSSTEMYHGFFRFPVALQEAVRNGLAPGETVTVRNDTGETSEMTGAEAARYYLGQAVKGYRYAWGVIRPYMINSLVVCISTACGVLLLGSISAYVLSRQRFFGSKAIFYFIISTMMFPGVLTLVPAFLLVKSLGLLNSYWAMILPYVAGGQVFAIFVFKSFFEGLPEDLFESARIDGAGHLQVYRHIVIPLSKPILSVVAIMNILGTWNNFLWPFITNTENTYHVIASGLFVMATSAHAQNPAALNAAYMISSVPLLILFVYATRPFIQGVTSGAFKA
jgi:ABC-type glycerol-3-phosphate transport system permease component